MSTNTTELVNTASDLLHELTELERTYGEDRASWPAGKREHAERLEVRLARLTEQIETATAERAAKIDAVRQAAAKGNVERYEVRPAGTRTRRGDPWHGLDRAGSIDALDSDAGLKTRAADAVEQMRASDAAKQMLATMLDEDVTSTSARFVLAAGSPAYDRAFRGWLADPDTAHMSMTAEETAAWRDVRHMRTALDSSSGSAILPISLDPVVLITNQGVAGSVRQFATVKSIVTNAYRGVSTAGITAEWKAEGSEGADATPALSAVSIPVFQGWTAAIASYELFDDVPDMASTIAQLIADARVRQENTGFTTGAGSTEPYGVITRIEATTASRVAPTTGGSFGAVDVWKLRDALPPRERAQRPVWLANVATFSRIQQFDTAGGSQFWSDLSGPAVLPSLLGHPVLECSTMDTAVTTGSAILGYCDMSQYFVIDRLGTAVELHNVQGNSNRSTGQREIIGRWRVGGDLANVDAGRVLRL